jgi:hypothetical protein
MDCIYSLTFFNRPVISAHLEVPSNLGAFSSSKLPLLITHQYDISLPIKRYAVQSSLFSQN